jgi:hypothetical protein
MKPDRPAQSAGRFEHGGWERIPLLAAVDLVVTGPGLLRQRVGPFLPERPSRELTVGLAPGETEVQLHLAAEVPAQAGEFIATVGPAALVRLADGALSVQMSRACARVRGTAITLGIPASVPPALLGTLLEIAWPIALAPLGLYRLHSAAVRSADGTGWLLVGPSGVGKSTSAVALAASGWSFASDDATYVSVESGRLEAHGWREPVRLTAESARALRVSTAYASAGRKARALLDADVEALRVPSVTVHRVMFVELGPTTTTHVVGASDAMTRLIRVSPWVSYLPDVAQPYLSSLAQIARLPAGRLVLGPELLGHSDQLATQLTAMTAVARP